MAGIMWPAARVHGHHLQDTAHLPLLWRHAHAQKQGPHPVGLPAIVRGAALRGGKAATAGIPGPLANLFASRKLVAAKPLRSPRQGVRDKFRYPLCAM